MTQEQPLHWLDSIYPELNDPAPPPKAKPKLPDGFPNLYPELDEDDDTSAV